MLQPLTKEQAKQIKEDKQYEEQVSYAQSGVSTAIEGNLIVTIGDADSDYLDWKHFVVAQIFRLGIGQYCSKTGWDIEELVEDLAEEDQSSDIWRDDALEYFDGMEGDY